MLRVAGRQDPDREGSAIIEKARSLRHQQVTAHLFRVFGSKINNEKSYVFVIQLYMSLIKKFGQFDKKFLCADLTHKVLRKGIYSINMEGKRYTLELLNCLSEVDKISYGNANCIRLFENLMNFHLGKSEL